MRESGEEGSEEEYKKRAGTKWGFRLFMKDLAASYSRGGYTTTTIGNVAFDVRVRDGNGSDHNFMATKKLSKEQVNVH